MDGAGEDREHPGRWRAPAFRYMSCQNSFMPPSGRARAPDPADVLAARITALEFSLDAPSVALPQAAEAERAASQLGRVDLELRARLVQAHGLLRSGEIAAGGRAAHAINRQAMGRADTYLLARSHRALAMFSGLVGDRSAQLEHAVRAVELLDAQCSEKMRGDHQMVLGVALGRSGSYEESRERFQAAGSIGVAIGDVDLQISALNNVSYLEDIDPNGDATAAMRAAERMVALAAQHGVPLDMTCLETVARAQMGFGQYAAAEQTMLDALDEETGADPGLEGDADVECLITLAEIQRLLGATDRARTTLGRCLEQCEARGLDGIRVRILKERAELFAMEGAYRAAYEQLKAFQVEADALVSVERDTRARTLHAVFETEEARRDSLRFREMSLRDPLTGLYNRRHIDECLDGLLREAAVSGFPLSIGLVDLDHFKTVNDTLSHGVGDEVLKQVAVLLAGSVMEPAFAARLGGEEFLVVLPGCDGQEALARCEATRLRIAAHPWGGLTGDLTITTSIGVATVAAGRTTRSSLLAAADHNLYVAKSAGRNRTASDSSASVAAGGHNRRHLRGAI
jgi:two-component system cell cycle response regulator